MTPAQVTIVRELLRHLPQHEARVFGWRLRATGHPYSDLDRLLVGEAPVPLARLALLREAFEQSPLPFLVDLVDAQHLTRDTRARFLEASEPLIARAGER
jgi:predicted nucleotidyltransferase